MAKSGENRIQNPIDDIYRVSRVSTLEKRRIAEGLTVAELARISRTNWETVKNILEGRTKHPHRATLARLEAVFRGLIASRHRQVMKEIRRAEHGPVVRLDTADFTRQRPRDRHWLDDARVRGLATYIMVCEFGYPQAALASALHVSKTAIGKTTKQYEDWRDRRRTERIIAAVRARLGW